MPTLQVLYGWISFWHNTAQPYLTWLKLSMYTFYLICILLLFNIYKMYVMHKHAMCGVIYFLKGADVLFIFLFIKNSRCRLNIEKYFNPKPDLTYLLQVHCILILAILWLNSCSCSCSSSVHIQTDNFSIQMTDLVNLLSISLFLPPPPI